MHCGAMVSIRLMGWTIVWGFWMLGLVSGVGLILCFGWVVVCVCEEREILEKKKHPIDSLSKITMGSRSRLTSQFSSSSHSYLLFLLCKNRNTRLHLPSTAPSPCSPSLSALLSGPKPRCSDGAAPHMSAQTRPGPGWPCPMSPFSDQIHRLLPHTNDRSTGRLSRVLIVLGICVGH